LVKNKTGAFLDFYKLLLDTEVSKLAFKLYAARDKAN